MFKPLKKSMWIGGFFSFKSVFFLSNVHQIILILFVNFNMFHKKGSICSKHSKNKNIDTLLDFDTQTSLNTIIILNL
jgi:hypothetical protein